MTKIRDIDEFCKLYKINIPLKEEFDYYVSTLLKSNEYSESDFEKKFKDFAELESMVEKNQLPSVSKLKMLFLDTLAEYIKSTSAYKVLLESEIPKKQLNTKDWTSGVEPSDMLMSIDFRSANYSVLKTFDSNGELKGSWRELCESLLIPEALIESKSFRQIVYGNCSPKRLQTFQHSHIMTITEELKNGGHILENNLIFVSHDEFIIKIDPSCEDVVGKILSLKQEVEDIISVHGINMPIHHRVFKLEKIGKNKYIKNNFDILDNTLCLKYLSLLGIPGNKFFMYFKKHILKEPIEKRDLYFINDGELASWVVSDIPK